LNLVRIRPEAIADVGEAVEWYEAQRAGLGTEFLLELDAAIERAALDPEAYAVKHRDARRVLVRRFPYSVYYLIEPGAIEVFGVLHQHRVPRAWQSRLS
jgi:plasmid stabilization system protein ParE